MRIIAELAGGIMLLAIFFIGVMAIVKETQKPKEQEKKDGEDVGNGEGRGTSH